MRTERNRTFKRNNNNMKTRTSITFLLTTMMIISSSCNFHLIKNGTYRIPTVDNNVCKKLNGNVVLYAIFVDTRYTQPWTELLSEALL
jgi:hypothetical protein